MKKSRIDISVNAALLEAYRALSFVSQWNMLNNIGLPEPMLMGEKEIKSFAVTLEMNQFSTIMYLYGYKILIGLIECYKQDENYEKCAEIVKQIQAHNALVNDSVPTQLKRDPIHQ